MSSDPSTGFIPIAPNPFIVGTPVRVQSMFYGREAEFAYVRKRFKEADAEGGLLVFCGERRSGKTSILFQIVSGRLGPEFIPVLIDMQSMAIQNEADFYRKISEEMVTRIDATELSVPVFEDSSNPAGLFQGFVISVLKKNPGRKLILLFDEYELLEDKIDAGILTRDVLHILSNLMEHHEQEPVFMIFTGSLHVEERRAEYWRMFLGRSLHRRISYLSHDDALRLVTEPVEGRVHYKDGATEAIYRLTAGQPFYTQAVCQNLVDHLNETQSNQVAPEDIDIVARGIVDNPFPQMIFLWEGLEDNERLVLALLAESLTDASSHASADDLLKTLKDHKYPLDLDAASIAASLESLFKKEMLVKDHGMPPAYTYKMDLWRRWVQRMHSVWQVMRELGIDIRRKPPVPWWKRLAPALALVALAAVGGGLIGKSLLEPKSDGGGETTAGVIGSPGMSYLLVHVTPETAERNSRISFGDRYLQGGRSITKAFGLAAGFGDLRVQADGYDDFIRSLDLAAGDTTPVVATMIPHRGSARITSIPEGATVVVNDQAIPETTPCTIQDLEVPEEHTLRLSLPGHGPVTRSFRVEKDRVTELGQIRLSPVTVDFQVTARGLPAGAGQPEVSLDGVRKGPLPRMLHGVPVGTHRLVGTLSGYRAAELTLDVTRDQGPVALTFRRLPPGKLLVRSSRRVEVHVGGQKILNGQWASSELEYAVGVYSIQVKFQDGSFYEDTVEVRSGQLTVFNLDDKKAEWTPLEGTQP